MIILAGSLSELDGLSIMLIRFIFIMLLRFSCYAGQVHHRLGKVHHRDWVQYHVGQVHPL